MNAKGFVPLIIIALVAAAAIGGGTYLAVTANSNAEAKAAGTANAETQAEASSETGVQTHVNVNAALDWCSGDYAEQIHAATSTESNFQILEAKAHGFVEYKGRTACHIYTKSEVNAGGQKATTETNYYIYNHANGQSDLDGWLITKTVTAGQTFQYEFNWDNGECIGGSGCELMNGGASASATASAAGNVQIPSGYAIPGQ